MPARYPLATLAAFATVLFSPLGQAQSAPEEDIRAVAAMKAAGAMTCSRAKTEVLNFLYNDGEYAYLNQWHNSEPNQRATLTTLAKSYSDGTVMATVSAAPTPGGCDVSFTQVISTADGCAPLRETTFKDWVYAGQLAAATLYEEKEASSLSISLSNQAGGCLVVKTGVFYFDAE